MGDSKVVSPNVNVMGHDTDFRRLRAASQDNTAHIQKLNEELRKLRERIERELSKNTGAEPPESNTRKTKT
jgi:hypothetical protein